MKRWLFALTLLAVGTASTLQAQEMTVYKDPNCGCCSAWVEHLQAHGFSVTVQERSDLSTIKMQQGVQPAYASCHTAVIEGYTVEGHVPAEDIRRLLRERPAVRGLSVPGMPMGSPGMEGAYSEPYDVLSFDAEGKTAVYAHH